MDSRDFMLKGICLHGLLIIDAGTGAANTTLWLAKKLEQAGGGRIISIDSNPETFPDAKVKLGELAKLVEFVKADLVERDFNATGPDQLWVADITYIPTWSGFLYLSVVEDAWSRRVVGWSMASHLRTELVLDALDMAIRRRRPAEVIHHSDHGTHLRHFDRLRQALPRSRCPAVDGIGRRLLRQCPV